MRRVDLILSLALPLLGVAAGAQEPSSVGASAFSASIARTASQRCRARESVNACDDAIRWNPSDAALLMAMGDTLMRARRPGDAVRAYQRAATLAPTMSGIQGKIDTAQTSVAKLKAKNAASDATGVAPSSKRFSKSEPDTQTH